MLTQEQLRQELYKLGFKPDCKGFEYWIYALNYFRENRGKRFNMETLYEEIAVQFKKTRITVERNMRTAVGDARKNISEKYMIYIRLTNSRILYILGREMMYI